jgi:hypothetical protein
MKILFFAFIFLLNSTSIWAQQTESEPSISFVFRADKTSSKTNFNTSNTSEFEETGNLFAVSAKFERPKSLSVFTKPEEVFNFEKETLDVADEQISFRQRTKEKFHWKPALIESGIFLGIQHGFRMLQKKTRDELGGKFFRDWGKSIKNMRGWNDGDNAFTNYFAHPLQGGVTGRIFINNSDCAAKQEFGKSKTYWESRLKAFVWSAFWSTQFEFGPISEANLGNVGMRQKNGYSTSAWVDLVITPTVGTGVVILEDFFDKYVLKGWLEKKFQNKTVKKILRMFFTPTTGFANALRGKMPWWRENRPLF